MAEAAEAFVSPKCLSAVACEGALTIKPRLRPELSIIAPTFTEDRNVEANRKANVIAHACVGDSFVDAASSDEIAQPIPRRVCIDTRVRRIQELDATAFR
jgi:hypothetical protein